jgi:hypothetical protein
VEVPTKAIVWPMGDDGMRMHFEPACPQSRPGDHPSTHLQTTVPSMVPEPIPVNRTTQSIANTE